MAWGLEITLLRGLPGGSCDTDPATLIGHKYAVSDTRMGARAAASLIAGASIHQGYHATQELGEHGHWTLERGEVALKLDVVWMDVEMANIQRDAMVIARSA